MARGGGAAARGSAGPRARAPLPSGSASPPAPAGGWRRPFHQETRRSRVGLPAGPPCLERLEQAARGAGVDGGGGACQALAGRARLAGQLERQRGTQQQTIAMRAAILAVQHRRERARIVRGVASGQITRAAGSESVLRSEERRVGKECRSRWSPYH